MTAWQQQQGLAPPASRGRRRGATGGGALLGVLLLTILAMAPDAIGAPDWRRGVQEQLENQLVRPSGITLEQAANKVRRQTGGRVLSASPSERGDREGYEIRVLLEGKRVKSYFVDGQGRISSRD